MPKALLTDFYELTMMQGYFLENHNPRVIFDMFYRTNPFSGGYAIFAGLEDLLNKITDLSFDEDDIEYLKSLNKFDDRFIEYLKSYRFHGDIYAVREGTPVFPGEPLMRIETDLIDAQLIESILLNTVNFQTLIATKASRMKNATKGHGEIMEFGLRRAQGEDGAISASRSSFIGGSTSTSNTIAGKIFNIPVSGTMAHSWIMSFDNEIEAFRKFSDIYPDNSIFLIDTYDTLGSGIDAAIKIGLEMKEKGKRIGVRIDSGDLSYLTKAIRKRLDDAGLTDATICVSNDLTEEIILTLVNDNAPIDSWGIGTNLVTGGNQAALNGVYKLAAKEGENGFEPCLKVSNSYEKTTNPGRKQVYRFFDHSGSPLADLIALSDEEIVTGSDYVFYHPFSIEDRFLMKKGDYESIEPLLVKVLENGKRVEKERSLQEIQKFSSDSFKAFHHSYKRQVNPHIYKVSLTEKLRELKTELIFETRKKEMR